MLSSFHNGYYLVENHLHDMILKTFDPKKADAIFAEEGETPSWLAELIEYPTWRSLIYRYLDYFHRLYEKFVTIRFN